MSIRTFDEYCALEESDGFGSRLGAFAGRPRQDGEGEFSGYDWIDDSETRDSEAVDNLLRGFAELEEVY